MKKGTDKVLYTTEMWDHLRDSVNSRNALIDHTLAEINSRDWKEYTPRQRASIAIACALDLPTQSPENKRQALQILEHLEKNKLLDVPTDNNLLSLSETTENYNTKLDFDKQRWLARGIQWILSSDFRKQLNQTSGPVAAFNLIRKNTPILKQHRSALFLASIGFPILIPDSPRRRFFHRYQGTNTTQGTIKNLQRTIQLGDTLAQQIGISTLECNLYIGALTGSKDIPQSSTPICATTPNCLSCQISENCNYATFQQEHGNLSPVEQKKHDLSSTIPASEQPREKLKRLGPSSLSNGELLAILLRTGTTKENVLELSQRLLHQVDDSLERLESSSLKELLTFNGLGEVKAITIKAALELARRLDDAHNQTLPKITNSKSIYQSQRLFFLNRKEEVFTSLLLDAKNHVMRRVIISQGTINQSLVHPGHAFREAIRDSALRVVFIHNHPSGDPSPSTQDINITSKLKKVGDTLGITVVDHIIIGKDSYFSFADEGKL